MGVQGFLQIVHVMEVNVLPEKEGRVNLSKVFFSKATSCAASLDTSHLRENYDLVLQISGQ